MCFGHYDPKTYYATIFELIHEYHYSLTEIEGMYPFELELYIQLIIDKETEKKRKREQAAATARMRKNG